MSGDLDLLRDLDLLYLRLMSGDLDLLRDLDRPYLRLTSGDLGLLRDLDLDLDRSPCDLLSGDPDRLLLFTSGDIDLDLLRDLETLRVLPNLRISD